MLSNQTSPHRNTLSVFIFLVVSMINGVSTVHASETITYYHLDAQGSPIAATDQQGNVIWTEHYQPYGQRIDQSPQSQTNSRWYTGHPQDDETGLTYMGARYYDPAIGRFYAIDPQDFSESNLHSFNRYAYGNNNPYKYVDPDGRFAVLIPWVIGAGLFLYDMSRPVALDAHGDAPLVQISTMPGPMGMGGAGLKAGKEAAEAGGMVAKEIGILRDAASGKGNFGLGSATKSEAETLGNAWVGEGSKVASDGKTLVSGDGLRQYRPPSAKPNSAYAPTGEQANFERRFKPEGQWQSNGHLDITH